MRSSIETGTVNEAISAIWAEKEAAEAELDALSIAGDEAGVNRWFRNDRALFARILELAAENTRRMDAAKALLVTFPEEAQDSGMLNAQDTFADHGKSADLNACEYWETAAYSAQSMVE
jgi:hypothetical protein